jgi:hypothetical protein
MIMEENTMFSTIGWMLILLGVIFVTLPYLTKIFPSIEKIPWYIVWVYKKDGFYFATSPILIFISLLSFILHIIRN